MLFGGASCPIWFNAVATDVRHSNRNFGKAPAKTIVLTDTLLVRTIELDAYGPETKKHLGLWRVTTSSSSNLAPLRGVCTDWPVRMRTLSSGWSRRNCRHSQTGARLFGG
jgi:hypothetical protein